MENTSLFTKLRNFFATSSYTKTISVLATLILVAAIPLTVFLAQQQQDLRQRAAGETWIITAEPVCSNGATPTGRGRMFWTFWPPSPLVWQRDDYAVGIHTRSITHTGYNFYIGMETEEQIELSLEPIEPKPHAAMEFGENFNPPTWTVRVFPGTLPSGQYTIKFRAPDRWCNIVTPPTPTPTQPPTALPQGLTIRPVLSCSNTPISDFTNAFKFIYSEERNPSGQARIIAVADRDAGNEGTYSREWEYRRGLGGTGADPDLGCSFNSCTLTPDEALYGNRCCMMQPGRFEKVRDIYYTNPNDTLTIQPDTTYHARLIVTTGSAPVYGITDERATFSIPRCAAPTPTPTIVPPTATPIPPTPTPGINNIALTFHLKLGAIGAIGENTNPQTRNREITVQIFNAAGQQVGLDKTGQVAYQTIGSLAGRFTGTLNAGALPPGAYTVKVKTPRYLRKRTGILTIAAGTNAYELPQTALIAGDIDGNNRIDILDYNIIVACFNNTASCDANKRLLVDLDDSGIVTSTDYNIFVIGLSAREGD